MDTKNVSNEFDSTNIFLFFFRWWKQLAIVCVTAAILASIFSSSVFITPLYESTVVMFPAQSTSLSRAVFGANVDFLQYGDVDDAERLLQVMGSTAIRNRIVERFDLFDHYEIPEDSKYRNTELRQIYGSNVSSRRTPYGAVEIKVRDKSPEMAADMANEISALADTLQNEIRQERALMAYRVAVQRYENLQKEITITEDSLRIIMERGIYEYEAQAEMLTRQLAIDLSNNNQRGVNAIEERLNVIREHGGSFLTQKAHLEQVSRSLSGIQRIMQEARADLENFVPFKFLIDEAFVAEKKVYPVRWLIVFLATFAAGLAGTLAIMTYENLVKKGIISPIKALSK
ncbi:MAG: hypothetical protein EA361_17535 [Bacteroidetes bacterium]|nr:MAG: hypothetical protein EA361_17535 [Bacteroidota bacterium]